MSYIALARKWRPRTFSQLVGQDHINQALINSLNQQRLHHAYLFTGTRGVGKTSVARLLAKALNCEQGITAEPCLTCDACVAIEQGRFIDLIEIDGASKTRVEDTREILENVQYAPTCGRFKIYLIDEVHMLSQHSFNALLKTLEEPPAHVKFLLATTDPQKLPVTILSRCLQFNLKHIHTPIIAQQLQHILDDEKLAYDLDAITLLATAARGSMRDALSLLDQAIAACGHHLHTQDVNHCLGYTQHDYALQLLNALVALAPEKLITISRNIGEEGGHFRHVLDEMLGYLHQINVAQTISGTHPFISPSAEITALSTQLTPEDAQLFYQIALKGTQDMPLAPTMAIGFEMTLLRMYTFKPAAPQTTPSLAYQSAKPTENIPAVSPTAVAVRVETPAEYDSVVGVEAEARPRADDTPAALSSTWGEILAQLNLQGLTRSAAENAELMQKAEGVVVLRVSKGHQSLFTPTVLSRIEQGLSHYYSEKIKVTLNSDQQVSSSPMQQKQVAQKKQGEDAASALQNDPFFQQLQQTFSGELVKNSIALLKDDL
ncbi:MAG TPA: DNA polymerase III subunit gamma/tau [Legionella sp.]|nr:DNA polymerase III subunit gamma/tau [Legionella sp.]